MRTGTAGVEQGTEAPGNVKNGTSPRPSNVTSGCSSSEDDDTTRDRERSPGSAQRYCQQTKGRRERGVCTAGGCSSALRKRDTPRRDGGGLQARRRAGSHGEDAHLLVDQLLGEPEVGELDVAVAVQQNVFRLQVPVDDLLGVQVLDGADDLR